jgi:TPR repeat protein/Zn-dependent protease with chaperone function
MLKKYLLFILAIIYQLSVNADEWDIRQIAKNESQYVKLNNADGTLYTSFSSESARELIAVVDKISLLSGIYPKVLLSSSKEINASAGYIYGDPTIFINRGMLDLISKDDSIVSALLGHEIAHLYFRHGDQKSEINKNAAALASFIGGFLEAAFIGRYGIVGLGVDLSKGIKNIAVNSYSRDFEREADKQGTIWSIQAGFDPRGSSRLFEELKKANGNSLTPFLDSHPSSSERIETTKRLADDFSKYKSIEVLTSPELLSLNHKIDEDRIRQLPKTVEGKEALILFSERNYQGAKDKLEICASAGEVACINNIGVLYQYGLGVPADIKEAAKYYKLASDKGSGLAQFNYIVAYVAQGGEVDPDRIIEMSLEASEKGSPRAMGSFAAGIQLISMLPNEFSSVYEKSLPKKSLVVNYAKAAAMRGSKDGALALGNLYLTGWGVSQNLELAENYLTQALAMNDFRAYAGLLNLYETIKPEEIKAQSINSKVTSNPNLDSAVARLRAWFYCGSDLNRSDFKDKCFELAKKGRSQSAGPIIYGYAISQGKGTQANLIEGAAWLAAYRVKNSKHKLANAVYQSQTKGLSTEDLQRVKLRSEEIISANFR